MGQPVPAVGVRFRGHVKTQRNRPLYWTTCRVTACEPGREFGFQVLVGNTPVNNWHYRFTPTSSGTDVTESFWVKNYGMPRVVQFCVRRTTTPTQHSRYDDDARTDQSSRGIGLEQAGQDLDQEVAAGSPRKCVKTVAEDGGEIEITGDVEAFAGDGGAAQGAERVEDGSDVVVANHSGVKSAAGKRVAVSPTTLAMLPSPKPA